MVWPARPPVLSSIRRKRINGRGPTTAFESNRLDLLTSIDRLMREEGLEGVIRGQRRRSTSIEPFTTRPPDLVPGLHQSPQPAMVADLTSSRTWLEWAYAARVLDICSRRMLGWSMATHMLPDM
jgi:transposase InsO family protein